MKKIRGIEAEVMRNPVVLAFTTMIEMANKLVLPITVVRNRKTGDVEVQVMFRGLTIPDKKGEKNVRQKR